MLDDALRRASEDEVFKSRMAFCCNHDEVEIKITRKTANLVEGPAFNGVGIVPGRFDRIFSCDLAQMCANASYHFPFRDDKRDRKHGGKREIRLEDMNQMRLGSKLFE
jgi:hypothetical protein